MEIQLTNRKAENSDRYKEYKTNSLSLSFVVPINLLIKSFFLCILVSVWFQKKNQLQCFTCLPVDSVIGKNLNSVGFVLSAGKTITLTFSKQKLRLQQPSFPDLNGLPLTNLISNCFTSNNWLQSHFKLRSKMKMHSIDEALHPTALRMFQIELTKFIFYLAFNLLDNSEFDY